MSGVVPDHRHQAVARVVHPRGTIEPMALGHDRFAHVVDSGPQGHQAVPGTLSSPARWASRTATIQSPSGVAQSPPWAQISPGGGSLERALGAADPPSVNQTRWSSSRT